LSRPPWARRFAPGRFKGGGCGARARAHAPLALQRGGPPVGGPPHGAGPPFLRLGGHAPRTSGRGGRRPAPHQRPVASRRAGSHKREGLRQRARLAVEPRATLHNARRRGRAAKVFLILLFASWLLFLQVFIQVCSCRPHRESVPPLPKQRPSHEGGASTRRGAPAWDAQERAQGSEGWGGGSLMGQCADAPHRAT
jgi:hypothetical protein